jgi:3'-5' exonuclease
MGTKPTLYSWAYGRNQGMAVQLLVVGDMASSVGDLSHGVVLVRGTTVVDKKESLRNWSKNSQLDVKVSSIQPVNDTIWTPLTLSSDCSDDSSQLYQTCPSRPTIDADGLRFLRLTDVYDPSHRKPITLVNSFASIDSFARSVAKLNSTVASSSKQIAYVGIDCEWKPDTLSQPEDVQPILLLQIALHDAHEVYLLDLQHLLRPLMPPGEELNAFEASVSSIVSDLWQSSRFVKVGFQLVGDLRRLAASYPHMKCFGTVHSVMEVSRVARKVMRVVSGERNSKFVTSSFARLVEHNLQRAIDKEQQCSDWSARPLSAAQLEYAALDAAIAPYLLDRSLMPCGSDVQVFREPRLQIGRWIGDVSFADCITSWEFVTTTSASAPPFRGESMRRRDKRHQRWFGNLPPVVTRRRR